MKNDLQTPTMGNRLTRWLLRDLLPTTVMLFGLALAMAWVNS